MRERNPEERPRSRIRWVIRSLVVAAVLAVAAGAWACSPIYVIKAGIAEARILHARRPIAEVIADSSTDTATRDKLSLVLEARRFAADHLGMKPGGSYTTYVHLQHDTLALVLSAAYKDRLVNKTWWFPIIGHVPYKGFFNESDALEAQKNLESDGLDTYLRPTSAFSTLGWFNDPILSTVLNTSDGVEVVTTVLHELAHGYLFVPGHVGFNESYATFIGHVGAEQFFCNRKGGGPDTVWCHRAEARWRDFQRFSVFVDGLVAQLDSVYGDSTLTFDQKVKRRQVVFHRAIEHFKRDVQPTFEAYSFASFVDTPLNNATLLARIRYFHRLPDFQALLDAHRGNLRAVLRYLRARAPSAKDPFDVLPTTPEQHPFEPEPHSR